MGVGHVPTGTIRQERQGLDIPRCQHRGARADLGSLGEQIAASFLSARGALILERNVRIGRGELDLIVSLGGERIAVEVKSGSDGNDPIFHFDSAKQQRVRSLAAKRGIARIDYVGVSTSESGVTVRWLPRVC
ncbi:MAG: hypothetical protein GY722_09375 [bacterium]|nr:hypothetical protein [bacterium]